VVGQIGGTDKHPADYNTVFGPSSAIVIVAVKNFIVVLNLPALSASETMDKSVKAGGRENYQGLPVTHKLL